LPHDADFELAYPDSFVRSLVTEMQALCTGGYRITAGGSEVVPVTHFLTGVEITQILSALTIGAQLIYPDDYHQVIYAFQRGLECSMLCDAIAQQCLSNDGFRQSLINALAGAGALTTSAGSDTVDVQSAGTVLINFGTGCDDDDRYGGAYAMVDLLDDVAVDILDIISALTNQVDVATALARNIPIIGNVAAFALDVATLAIDIWIDLYLAAYNTTSHDEIACAVFCEIGGCEMTLEQVINGYSNLLGETLPPPPDLFPTSFEEVVGWLIDVAGDLTTDVHIVAAFHWLILQALARGSAVSSTTTRIMQIALSIYNPIPPPEECDCAVWTHVFLDGENGMSFITLDDINPGVTPTYDAINDRIDGACYGAPTGAYWMTFTINLPEVRNVTGISITVNANDYRSISIEQFNVYKDGSYVDGEIVHSGVPSAAAVYTLSASFSAYTTKIGVEHWQGVNNDVCPDPEAYLRDVRIELSGRGADPFL